MGKSRDGGGEEGREGRGSNVKGVRGQVAPLGVYMVNPKLGQRTSGAI